MKKTLIALLIILGLYTILVIYTNYNYKEKAYYDDYKYEYVLKVNKPFVTINKYLKTNEGWQCSEAPCPELHRKLLIVYTLPLTKHYKEIIKNYKQSLNEYKIIEKNDYSEVKSQGYIYDDRNDELSIYLGQKNTGGYEIKVVNVEINKLNKINYAYVEIEEVKPKSGETVTQAFTQPMIKIKFNKHINIVEVSDINTGTYEEIKENE